MQPTIAAVASEVRTPGTFNGSRDHFQAVLS